MKTLYIGIIALLFTLLAVSYEASAQTTISEHQDKNGYFEGEYVLDVSSDNSTFTTAYITWNDVGIFTMKSLAFNVDAGEDVTFQIRYKLTTDSSEHDSILQVGGNDTFTVTAGNVGVVNFVENANEITVYAQSATGAGQWDCAVSARRN